ncbi:uncharacterized protein LOC125906049 isoform X5 [Epinephelus fuscoguttatus]|uniref:uncharacterized protein LOC125906049 isoform X4 n=1 Tax=Epinephelus fuscoguttatus TaxID=293821 RepID=UPI0020D0A5C0|nr:uncharacterized protein LOC125906049 isoform X4 [Epinephelus fuscoguttatus]XP_049460392.1 uncharacterized protein LOC125906049 isoform X4 [Epinephelus fuscoguttatus]XP_049460393.1 uncharacterized protein LOC125906049 isoform X5 [Epinephelus fuscoguttatus]
MATKVSSKYDHITCKVLIRPGSPNVYRLKPKKENIGTLTRKTLSEKDPSKLNKTILLVGETGAGKSTLINTLVNYTMGVKWEDDVWFQIVEDEKKSQSESQTSDVTDFEGEEKSQCESQTTDVIVYEIFGFEGQTLPYSLTIIDTPGYGDTRGTEHDVIVSERLLDLFRSDDGVHEIDAVGLVMKASENRLSDRLRYIFDSVVSLFGKNMEKNIVALITHSNGVTPENVFKGLEAANIKCARDEENEPVHFVFDNCQSTQKTKKNNVALKNAWSLSEDQMGQFTDFLQNTSSNDLTTTVEVLNRRTRLTACIHNLQERIEFIELKQSEIQQTQEALKKYEQEMKNNKEFTVEVEEVYKVKEPVSEWRVLAFGLNYGGAVCCTVCKENCHYPCTLAWSPEHCKVMKKKCTVCKGKCFAWPWAHEKIIYCTVCTGKCPASVHVKDKQCTVCEDKCCVSEHEKGKQCPVCKGEKKESDHVKTMWKYVSKTRKVQRTIQDMKEKYEKSKAGCEESTSLLETLQKNIEELEKEKDQWLEEAFQHVVTLEQLALNVKSLSTFVHLDFLIEKMKEKGDTEKVTRLEKMKDEMDKNEGIKAALWYGFGRVTAAGRAIKTAVKYIVGGKKDNGGSAA